LPQWGVRDVHRRGGHDNKTARTIAFYEGDKIERRALTAMLRGIIANNRAGGWRNLKKPPGTAPNAG